MALADLTDAELLERARRDPEALGVFYDRHERAVLGFFVRRTRDPEQAADLTAETFAHVVAHCRRGRPVQAPLGWLYRIAANQLADLQRRGRVADGARRRLGLEHAVQAGPLTFLGLASQAGEPDWRYAVASELARHLSRDEAEQVLENGRNRYAAVGLNVLVEPGKRVTVALDPRVRGRVGLLTDLPKFGGYRARDGVSRVTFASCPAVPREAREVDEVDQLAFGLAFIVEGARCVPLLVMADGERTRKVVSFGAGRCR